MPRSTTIAYPILAALGFAAISASSALGAPPTDEQIEAAIDAYDTIRSEVTSREQYEERLAAFEAEHAEAIDLSQLNAATIERMSPVMFSTPERAQSAIARLGELEHPQTEDGAIALINGTFFTMMANRQLPELSRLKIITAHPALDDAIRSGNAEVFFTMLGYMGQYRPAELREIRDRVVLMDRLVSDDMDAQNALASTGLFDAVNAILTDSDEDKAIQERFRASIASALRSARAETDDRLEMAAALDDAITRTDGAFARGQLVGYPAPDLDFTWASDASLSNTRLSDLRGKVVVLDFWATWCGPCLASIPNIRSLVSYYQGTDVVVLGVTSLQGFHADQAQGRIETEGNPDREYELMSAFAAERNMTWPVVFSEQDVFNPEYGIDGIPHMVIIDAAGKVRHRALHPATDLNEKIAMIDPLLLEAGLELPEISKSAAAVSPDDDGHGHDESWHDHPEHSEDGHEGHDHP